MKTTTQSPKKGLTCSDWQAFNDLLIKANHQQLYVMKGQVRGEIQKRGMAQ